MARLTLPVAKVDDDDVGSDLAVTVADASVALAIGMYKIAAVGTSLKWKLGAVAATPSTGSYLADGDQEVIRVREATDIHAIRSTNAAGDGSLNIVVANLYDVLTEDPRNS